MKTLARSSKLMKWAFLFEQRWDVNETDTCSLFWRCVLLTPLKLMGLAVGIALGLASIGGLLFLVFEAPIGLLFVGAIVLAIAVMAFIAQRVAKIHGVAKERGICSKIKVIN